jgi:hypothetical protein
MNVFLVIDLEFQNVQEGKRDMKLEYCLRLSNPYKENLWKPLRATNEKDAAQESAPLASIWGAGGILCRNAETKELIQLSYRKNAGQICDTNSGPCSCGAWH